MEESFADLLGDAFSDASLPSFSDGELDFETLHLNEKFEGAAETNSSKENITEEEEALYKEATNQTRTLSSALTTINTNMAENDEEAAASKMDEDVSTGTGVCITDNTTEEQYYCSNEDFEQGYSESSKDKEEEDTGLGNKLKGWSVAVHCSKESLDDNNQDGTLTEGQPQTPEGTANPQVRNEEQGESDSDEGQFYIGKVPMPGSELKKRHDRTEEGERPEVEEKPQDGSDSESEGKKIANDERKEVNLLTQCPLEISTRTLQNLITGDDNEDVIIDKMKDFSGDDHQEAGETFADFPSDFSCEYMEYGGYNKESKLHVLPCTSESVLAKKESSYLGQSLTEITSVRSAERKDQDLDSGWTGINADLARTTLGLPAGEIDNEGGIEGVKSVLVDKASTENDTGDGITAPKCLKTKNNTYTEVQTGPNQTIRTTASLTSGETFDCGSQHQHYSIMGHRLLSECDSYSSGDDDVQVMEGYGENTEYSYRDSKSYNQPKDDFQLQGESTAVRGAISGELAATDAEGLGISLDTVMSTLEDFELLRNRGDAYQEETSPWSPVMSSQEDLMDDTMHSPNQGSVDDGFFFNDEYALRITEPGEFRDDEYEEERNWEQEQERIKAFYNFYNDSEGVNSTGRKIKVQFCSEPLSQVIHYDSDSSGRESPDSSTDGEEDQSSGETDMELMESEALTMNNVPYSPHNLLPENVQNLNRTTKCLGILKLILKMGLVVLMGLLMFWWANNQLDWLS